MDKKQTATLLTFLRSSFPKQADLLAQPETAEIWHRALADIDYDAAQLAITKWIMTEKWLPTIADIREMVADVTTENVLDWSEAWEIVNKAVRTIGPYQQDEAFSRFDEITAEAVRRIGYMTLCEMEYDERDIMRAQFRDIYNQIANRHKQEAQMPIALKDKIRAMQIGTTHTRMIEGRDE